MPKKKYDKDKITTILKNLARRLGSETLTQREIAGAISISSVKYHFGSVGNALEAAGLKRAKPGANLPKGLRYSDTELFNKLLDVERKLGHEPTYNECSAHCEFSTRPYVTRFGKWANVLAYYRKWKYNNIETIADDTSENGHNDNKTSPVDAKNVHKIPDQFYGEPIDFRGLRHAPINEQGVVFLFGMVSRELGFNIEAIQQGFPDSEGKYLYDQKKGLWAKARIEFEYKASSFKSHGHDPTRCDFIVCWHNDWPDCPINVIELKSEILKLPNR